MSGSILRRAAWGAKGPVVLRSRTDDRWVALAVSHLDEVLVDHAHCEKKAAANALSLLQAYPEVDGLAEQMAELAREESGHLTRVLGVLKERGLALGRDRGDPYAQKLQRLIRTSPSGRRLDRLLVAAVIEARSCERLALLAGALEKTPLGRMYRDLAQSEEGHQRLFFRLAARSSGSEAAAARLGELLDWEQRILTEVGLRAAIH
jgi:tRNA-(ms[2]io[6]A)-hydroxylase